jgi:putative hemolysin
MQSLDELTARSLPESRTARTAAAIATCNDRRFVVQWANSEEDVRAAQRLRYQVFAYEMGAQLSPPTDGEPGLDIDYFDQFCDHLLVRIKVPPEYGPGPVIGTYRVLAPGAAIRAGGLYTETEFDLSTLAPLRANAVELGRSCVHPAWRSGSVIMALWSALGQYMHRHALSTMIGCASISLANNGRTASAIWLRLQQDYMADPCWRVQPRNPLKLVHDAESSNNINVCTSTFTKFDHIPPLLKGYLRCGARLLGPPAFDPQFNTADLPIMVRIDELAPRYRKHFFGR